MLVRSPDHPLRLACHRGIDAHFGGNRDLARYAERAAGGHRRGLARDRGVQRGIHEGSPHRLAGIERSGAVRLDRRLVMSDTFLDALRSEEHTSELQSLMRISYAVFCLKKKKKTR